MSAPSSENGVDNAGAPSCILGAVNAPLEPLVLRLKFPLTPGFLFSLLVSLEMTLSESQLLAAMGGGGGAGWVGEGKQNSLGKAEPARLMEGGGAAREEGERSLEGNLRVRQKVSGLQGTLSLQELTQHCVISRLSARPSPKELVE